jgi:hypothetical protein
LLDLMYFQTSVIYIGLTLMGTFIRQSKYVWQVRRRNRPAGDRVGRK